MMQSEDYLKAGREVVLYIERGLNLQPCYEGSIVVHKLGHFHPALCDTEGIAHSQTDDQSECFS